MIRWLFFSCVFSVLDHSGPFSFCTLFDVHSSTTIIVSDSCRSCFSFRLSMSLLVIVQLSFALLPSLSFLLSSPFSPALPTLLLHPFSTFAHPSPSSQLFLTILSSCYPFTVSGPLPTHFTYHSPSPPTFFPPPPIPPLHHLFHSRISRSLDSGP